MTALTIDLPDAKLDELAARVAEILRESEPAQTQGFLDVKGAADFLACKPDRIYALKSAGRIPFHKDGSRLLFDPQELRAWVRAGGGIRP